FRKELTRASMESRPSPIPESRARWIDPLLFGAIAVAGYATCARMRISTTTMAVLLVAAETLLMCLLELLDIDWVKRPRPDVSVRLVFQRAAVKWLGTLAGIALVLFGWWLLPEYRRPQYKALFD